MAIIRPIYIGEVEVVQDEDTFDGPACTEHSKAVSVHPGLL